MRRAPLSCRGGSCRPGRFASRACAALAALAVWLPALVLAQPAPPPQLPGSGQPAPARPAIVPTGPGEPPRVPPFVGTLINWDRNGDFTAMCTIEDGAKETKVGARLVKPTYVYVVEREIIRQLGSSPGACDPAFSPDGTLLAVATTNGLWTYSPRLEEPRQLAATRLPDNPTNEYDYTAFSKPKWSSDGRRIAFLVGNSGTSWVQVVDVATTRVLHKSPEETYSFSWTSDPRVITIGASTVRLP